MRPSLRKIIARGVCTFGAAIDRDQDGYGCIVAAKSEPETTCSEPCDYCWHFANHILQTIEDDEKWEITINSKL